MAKILLTWLLLSIGVCLYSNSHANEDISVNNREYQLKTAYLLHFAELTEWPELKPVTICLEGSSALRTYLPILEGMKVNNNAVHVIVGEYRPNNDCRILFLSELTALTKPIREQAKIRHILLVSDAENFAVNGGMIQFSLRDNKLKLVVNLSSVKDAGLKLSSKLLRMAEILE